MLTIFLFLFNVRSTLVAAVSIPLSILTALVVMQAAGITLNILTLGGLAVAVVAFPRSRRQRLRFCARRWIV